MDKEFKSALFLLIFLLGVSVLLLELLAGIHFYTKEFLGGFLPFALLVTPYILFSTRLCISSLSNWLDTSLWKKMLLPFYFLILYGVFSLWNNTLDPALFVRLTLWLFIPVFLFSLNVYSNHPLYIKEFLVVLWLWLPLEFGKLSGFDIIFSKGIQIPAQPFVAPVFGLYLFSVLRKLPDIGYTFQWRLKDLGKAAIALILLAVTLIPAGTQLGFISYSFFDTSFADMIKLFLGIYFLVALPEELLFRGIIQNLIAKVLSGRSGAVTLSLCAASIIFGLSHWNNFNPPDWRYVFLATVAGGFYGWTYIRTGKTTVSALVHCGVNFLWAVIFKDSAG